ncbi:folate-binding protein [Dokdonella sp.]|uniref:CAF17-like 4Fe-4S cluster assembly/insertion protein YgfZ n=1 Tax=Dokdonella sp. TaxID=2291710 RepID=UPI002F40C889
MPTALCRAELVALQGKDALAFAHAQFTSDVASLAPGRWQWSAWLDAHGRVRAVFVVLRVDDARLLAWQPLGDAAAVRDALMRYVFRSAVRIDVVDGWALHRLDNEAPAAGRVVDLDGGHAFALPGAEPRVAWLAPATSPANDAALAAWRRGDHAAHLPLLATELAGEFVPQALELERIDAIRFDKGCYPGQEIAARLHFRGGNKRHLQVYRIERTGAMPAPGANVVVGDATVGRILYSVADEHDAGGSALAVVVDEARGAMARTVDGHSLSPCA